MFVALFLSRHVYLHPMKYSTQLGRLACSSLVFVLLSLPCFPCASTSLTAQGDGGAMEEFEEVDPYTQGKQELLDKLGYVNMGAFPWHRGHQTTDIAEMLGGTPMIWVETEHFKIGSSLGTYKVPANKSEKERLKAEIGRLKKRFGRLRVPRNELDPWLRLHLYAQRAEELYASFLEDFSLAPTDFDEKNPYLGMPNKLVLLLCERSSELSRYAKTIYDQTEDSIFRWGQPNDCMFVGASLESIRSGFSANNDEPFDSIFYCQVAASLAANFIDGFQGHLYEAPRWLGNVLGHVYVRRIDPRWVTARGHSASDVATEDGWKWRPAVYQLVKNEFFATTEEMFGWQKYEDLNKRDHMIAWSKLDYLITTAEGDRKCFIEAMCRRSKGESAETEQRERQTRALLACYELTPAELDEAWAKWVSKEYKKR